MKQAHAASAMASPSVSREDRSANPAWKRWGKRVFTVAFLVLVPWLLFRLLKDLDWVDVTRAIGSISDTTLMLATAAALGSYFVYTGFELLGRQYSGHHLSARQVVPVAFVCYAFNLNLGAWVGSIALRYRLYSRMGLDMATITRVLSFSIITNWLGYLILAGILFSLRLIKLPENWSIGATGLQWLGFLLIGIAIGYLLACFFSRRREWRVGKHEISLPSGPVALMQATLGMLNWSLMALIIYLLLPSTAFYPTVLCVLLIASIAGVISHVPAGIGVLETVFIVLLQHQFSQGTLIGMLIGYRVIYFLFPLTIALLVYVVLEKNAKKIARQNAAA